MDHIENECICIVVDINCFRDPWINHWHFWSTSVLITYWRFFTTKMKYPKLIENVCLRRHDHVSGVAFTCILMMESILLKTGWVSVLTLQKKLCSQSRLWSGCSEFREQMKSGLEDLWLDPSHSSLLLCTISVLLCFSVEKYMQTNNHLCIIEFNSVTNL